MPLFELTSDKLEAVPSSTFAAEQVLERADLQRLLRAQIETVVEDVLIVSEEFAEFAGARRRIDLLGIDREGKPVVIELKRTTDGGHLELQALRYAAMVSALTFDDVSEAFQRYLLQVEPDAADDARTRLADWLEDVGGEDAVLTREVRVVLVSAGFDREITTTVLWLNEVYGLDIQCVRLTPYKVGERLLLDVQQVIPLPEAADLTVQLRRRETQARAARVSEGRDWTPYAITTPEGTTEPLRKRQAVLALVTALHAAGVPGARLAGALPGARFLRIPGVPGDDALADEFVARYPKAKGNLARWFIDSPLREADQTWLLSKMWGRNTEPVLAKLADLAPEGLTFGYEARPRD
ncbi:hypothetical protein [Amycolatopsis solani]|uniref:hypothetical protein n=1 Tax=Amycolatopsis solani TaxID=3028615 RepID=UPI0025B19F43|nr:hypothetical protein [Amycolatopsis sp. MEP2-6]